MKTASAYPSAYYVMCPACREGLKDPRTGSYMIGVDSLDNFKRAGMKNGVVSCFECGTAFRLPASVLKLGA